MREDLCINMSEADRETVRMTFDDMPLSEKTKQGLRDSNFLTPTKIQNESIGPALLGKDLVGSAVTGSGKTLAFLVPVLEHLFVNKWSRTDGLCVIVISPTRELSYQIFEMLRKIGKYHDFSAGLIIGGKNLRFEKHRMDKCNILICTPGRLLQHMDENPLFNALNVQMLVIDEADRCLDMGFESSLNAIIENLPADRQTLLFSATQNFSKDVIDRLKLRDPVFTGSFNSRKLPELLQQSYVVVKLEDKITMLWSFIKTHLKQKMLVFLTSCKQVKYMYELFCKLRPGTSLLALYGTQNQDRRIAVYNEFLKKRRAVLFATDIASRGLDFPSVHWAIQLDCPEDVTQYIHRAGRSARNTAPGESLLVLMPSEEKAMISEIQSSKVTVRKIEIDKKKMFSPHAKIEALCAQCPDLKASAQRAFVAYIKSICLMKNKKVFKVDSLNFNAFAKSLGLLVTPRVRFLERTRQNKGEEDNFLQSKIQASDDEEFFKVKRLDHDVCMNLNPSLNQTAIKSTKVLTKAALAKKLLKKKIQPNRKLKLDNDSCNENKDVFELYADTENEREVFGIDLEVSQNVLEKEDKLDKDRFKNLVKIRHKKMKQKIKKRRLSNSDEDNLYTKCDTQSPEEISRKKQKNLSLSDTEVIVSHLLALR